MERSKSSIAALSDIIPLIVDNLVKQLKSKNLKVRIAVMHTLAQLAQSLHSRLDQHFNKMLPELEKAMEETQGYDLILDTLAILRRLFRGSSSNN